MDARCELGRIERFGHVIVGANPESHHLVHGLIANCKYKNRDRDSPASQLATDVETIEARQHDVQDDQIESRTGGLFQALLSVDCPLNCITFRLQTVDESLT